MGRLAQRAEVLGLLRRLPAATTVTPEEMSWFVERHRLMGLGIGVVDIQLLAATQVTLDAALWTTDKRLAGAASKLGLAAGTAGVAGDA